MLTQLTFTVFDTVGGLGKPSAIKTVQPLPDITGLQATGGVFYHCLSLVNNSGFPVSIVATTPRTVTPDDNQLGFGKGIVIPDYETPPQGVSYSRSAAFSALPAETVQLWVRRSISPHTGKTEDVVSELVIEVFV